VAGCSSSKAHSGSSVGGTTAGGSAGANQASEPNATITLLEAFTGLTFDPFTSPGSFAGWSAWALEYDRLIQTTASGQLAPMLATSWKWDSTNTQLTMALRKDVMFQDGSAFNADVAVANLEAAAAPGTNGHSALETMTSVVAVDPYTIRLTFSAPNPAVLFTLSFFSGMEVSPKGLANPTLLKTQPMGSGPYELGSVSAALTYNYNRFDGYWDKSHVYPAHMQIITDISSATTELNAVQTTNDISLLQTSVIPTAKADKSLTFATYTANGVQVVFMNDKVAPLDNVNVRKAVSLAFDRQAFNQADNGACTPELQSFLPGMVGYLPSLTAPAPDVAQAKQLIQQAGATGATIKLLTINVAPYYTWAQVAQAELDAIGLNIQIVVATAGTYRTMYQNGGYGMLQATPSTTSSLDPTQMLDQYVLGQGNPGTKDPTLVAQINSAQQLSLGSPQRTTAYQKINQELSSQYFLWASECLPIYTYAATNKIIGLATMPDAFAGTPEINFVQMAK
jgi:ABC-type transport system substrate-binding protein